MKTIISTIIIAIGFYLILFSTRVLWRVSVFENDIATENAYLIDCLKKEHMKEKPNCVFNKEICLKENLSAIYEKKKHFSTLLIGSLIVLISGVTLYFYSKKNQIPQFSTQRACFLFRFTEITINTFYWLIIGLLYFTIQMLVKKEISVCVIDSMFIFYAAGLTGFYIAYFYLTDRFLKNKMITKWLVGCLLTIVLGFILSYLIPYFSTIISTPNSLSNTAFLMGFSYLSFFVAANIIVGTIFKGFFNWIKNTFCMQIGTQNVL
jgi:hypothetical protein